jgi:hypothetical protein
LVERLALGMEQFRRLSEPVCIGGRLVARPISIGFTRERWKGDLACLPGLCTGVVQTISCAQEVAERVALNHRLVRDSVYALDSWGCGGELDRDTPRSGSYQDTT